MRQRPINCDFHTVQLPPHVAGLAFEDMVARIRHDYPAAAARNYELADRTYLRLHQWESRPGGTWCGAVLRLRPETGAMVSRMDDDELLDVRLEENEVLCECMCFLYARSTSTLVCQRNVHAGRAGTLADYLEDKSNVRPIRIQPMMNSEAWRRLEEADEVRKVELQFSFPRHPGAFETGDDSLDRVISLSRENGAATLTLSLSVGHKRGGLRDWVKPWLARIYRPQGDIEVTRMRVTGREEDSHSYLIDLIADRMQTSAPVRFDGRAPRVEDIWSALYDAHAQMQPEIDRQMRLGA